jgi:hypothetical protein
MGVIVARSRAGRGMVQYARLGQGVAVQSSIGRAIDALTEEAMNVGIGAIIYADRHR